MAKDITDSLVKVFMSKYKNKADELVNASPEQLIAKFYGPMGGPGGVGQGMWGKMLGPATPQPPDMGSIFGIKVNKL